MERWTAPLGRLSVEPRGFLGVYGAGIVSSTVFHASRRRIWNPVPSPFGRPTGQAWGIAEVETGYTFTVETTAVDRARLLASGGTALSVSGLELRGRTCMVRLQSQWGHF